METDDIEVEVFNGDVSLNGTVPSQAQRTEAVAATARQGVIYLTGLVSNSAQRATAHDAVAGVAGVQHHQSDRSPGRHLREPPCCMPILI